MGNSTESAKKAGISATIHERIHALDQYRVITANEDILQRTGEQIVRACQMQISASAWNQNFSLMVEHVRNWCKDRTEKVLLALVDLRSDKTVFYIVPKSEGYDFELGEQQAELDIHLNTRGGIGYAETRQIPRWEIERFVSQPYLVYPLKDNE